ncbi:hypothetical protein P154DRAFT_568594 [Amniculicola lignicola CBS 123094]|uniref:Uncharacterized protein n=1 Tax=Amniculicola lignicola CBS 123094 TaxID=1392246 RepID=A0A6A5X4F9_9PLEO|nr:hypothetical protein P154DRAFT_568594 [Amniculicola lignicola CBS 123094]
MMKQNEIFLLGRDIDREVITTDIQLYLGQDALVRPGYHSGEFGYYLTANRLPSDDMIERLKSDSDRWIEQKRKGFTGVVEYKDSQIHAWSQQWASETTRFNYHGASDARMSPIPNGPLHRRSAVLNLTQAKAAQSFAPPARPQPIGNTEIPEEHKRWEAAWGVSPLWPMDAYASLDHIADYCQWQIGQERFCEGTAATSL